jgi:hypothetical protein
MTERRKITMEFLGGQASDTGVLTAIEEREVMDESGLTITNRVTKSLADCGHRVSGKEQTLAVCCVCGAIWCPVCLDRDKRSFCESCGRFLCPTHRRISILTGIMRCSDCTIFDVLKNRIKEGGFFKWLDRWLDWS